MSNPMDIKDIHTFFISVSPGLEELALKELKEKTKDIEVNKIYGGLELKGTLQEGIELNRVLKIPSRILLRMGSFKCRDFPKLFNKIKKYNWNQFIRNDIDKLSISAKDSRLFNTKKIEKTIRDAFKEFRKGNPQKEKYKQNKVDCPCTLFVRIENDLVTLSLDTSGELLYKRGLKAKLSVASMRENLASALYYKALLAYGKTPKVLFSPMCGAGTFLVEASYFNQYTNRDFSFENFPFLEGYHFEQKKEVLPEIKLIGLDQTIESVTQNMEKAMLEAVILEDDFFKDPPSDLPKIDISLINPPYGKRLKTEHEKGAFMQKIVNQLARWGEPEVMGIVGPHKFIKNLTEPKNYKKIDFLDFTNGGIKVKFQLFKRF